MNQQSNNPPAQQQSNTIADFENEFRQDLRANLKLFTALLGGDKEAAARFLAGAFQAARVNPDLLHAEPTSLLMALGEAASLGLSVNPNLQECYLIPYKNVVSFQTGFPGLIKLMNRGAAVDWIKVDVVRKGDIWHERGGTSPGIDHERPIEGEIVETDDGILAAYAVVKLMGSTLPYTAVVRRSKLLEARAKSGNPHDPAKWSKVWDQHFEAMAKKTAIRRVAKIVPGADDARMVTAREDTREAGRDPGMIQQLRDLIGEVAAKPAKVQPQNGLDGVLAGAPALPRRTNQADPNTEPPEDFKNKTPGNG